MLHVNFKTEEGNKVLIALDDKCPMGLVRIDRTLSVYHPSMPISLEDFRDTVESKDLWMSEFAGYYFIDGDVLYNTITSMYESSDFLVTMHVLDIRKNIIDTIILEAIEPEDENDKYNKRRLFIRFDKYSVNVIVKMKDIISALEIVTYKKE